VCAWVDGGADGLQAHQAGDAHGDVSLIAQSNKIVHADVADLWSLASGQTLDILQAYKDGTYTSNTRKTRLDWVGRNHAQGEKPTDNKTNFLYADGHVELKHISDTIGSNWQWGDKMYSISPNN
jgi:prepilin-type processing-associated H-X9-DG protein